jgi:PAS domain S-box-containing protein
MIDASDILKASILIVDDQEANVSLLEKLLRGAGYVSIASTTDPRAVCELHRQHRYSLILLDLQMPGLDGFQVMEGLKAIETDSYLPVLVITAQPDHKLRALKAGAKDFISKPFDLAEVLMRVRNMIEVRLLHLKMGTRAEQAEIRTELVESQSEQAIRGSELRYRRLFETAPDGILILDADTGQVVDANPFMKDLLGYSQAEFLGKKLWEIGPFKGEAASKITFAELQQKDQIRYEALPLETKDGRRVEVEFISNAYLVDQKRLIQCNIRDITERRKLEAQIRQSQKMEGIGQLAGGVAHDFNNILAVIQMQSDLLKTGGKLSPAQFDFAEQIGAAVERAAALTRQLLLFSRKEILQLHDLDLNQSLNSMTKMLQRILGENIQMQFKFAPQPLFIHADAGMMDQVLMNLAINSRDAMPQGGRLVIETSIAEFDEAAARQSPQIRPGSFVCLSVSDTGCGIPAEILPKIFEPFFTTKGVGKGTGLGLATVFGIVQQHQGWIHVYSEAGHGTTFRIYLPWLSGTTDQTIAEKMLVVPMLGGNETILLVEDDAFLRVSVRKALSQLGYRLLEAGNAAEALEAWQLNRAEIHLLLTDLVMPGGMNGRELAERLLKENPQLKVIYASGYSAEVAAKNFPLEEGVNFLAKPFQTFKLAQTVRKNLDANKQSASQS